MKRLASFASALLLALVVFIGMDQKTSFAADGGITPPISTQAKAAGKGQCVAPVDVMRREHMTLLIDQRDQTLRQGKRGMKFSLQGCVECHAVADPKAPNPAAATFRTVQPFCSTCHDYASVSIDCFSCHTDRARGMTPALKGLISLPTAQNKARAIEDMQAFLRSHKKTDANDGETKKGAHP